MVGAPLLLLLVHLAAPPTAKRQDPYSRVQQASALIEHGQYRRALDIVDALLAEYPKSQSSHLLRGMALDELGRLDEAERSYRTALQIAPDDAQILARYGMHRLRAEDWPGAIRLLEQSLASREDALSYFYLAQAYFHTDAKAKAFVSFLGGISALDVSFSKDGQWVAYCTYPDGILWRSSRALTCRGDSFRNRPTSRRLRNIFGSSFNACKSPFSNAHAARSFSRRVRNFPISPRPRAAASIPAAILAR